MSKHEQDVYPIIREIEWLAEKWKELDRWEQKDLKDAFDKLCETWTPKAELIEEEYDARQGETPVASPLCEPEIVHYSIMNKAKAEGDWDTYNEAKAKWLHSGKK